MISKREKSAKDIAIRTIFYIVLILGAIIMIAPFLWTVSTSLKVQGLTQQIPPQFIPKPIYWSNYVRVWEEMEFIIFAKNSLIVTVLSVTGAIISCSFVGFGLAKMNFPGKKILFFFALATLIMPYQVLMISIYGIWKKLGLLDTFAPLFLQSWLGYAFGIFIMRQAFKSLPGELLESATIDGCNPFYAFWKIYLPLATPSMAALGVFNFMGCWNDVLRPLIYLTTKSKYTLTIGLLFLRGEYVDNLELLMAGSIIMMIPVIMVFLSAQKFFIQGISTSGLKG